MRKIYLTGIFALFTVGCRPGLEIPIPDPGVLDLASYIAVGDGYTAGISDALISDSSFISGWHPESQQYSYPALIARQFSLTGADRFSQPSLSENGTGRLFIESVSEPLCEFEESSPVVLLQPGEIDWELSGSLIIPDNLGMPGLSVSELSTTFNEVSSPAWPLLGGKDLQSYTGLIRESKPKFFSLFMGLEEYISFALSSSQSSLPGKMESIEQLSGLLEALVEIPGSRGLVANMPDATAFPYFTRLGNQFISVENCKGTSSPIFITSSDGKVSEADSDDRILMPARPYLGTEFNGAGPFGLVDSNPVPERWVMDQDEVQSFRASIRDYNAILDSLVRDINLNSGYQKVAIVDLFSAFQELETGIIEDGIALTTEYLSGGIFSLDGLYLTSRGNAWLANEFINTINQVSAFGARIPPLDITSFQGVRYP